jgi:hypothetical protein
VRAHLTGTVIARGSGCSLFFMGGWARAVDFTHSQEVNRISWYGRFKALLAVNGRWKRPDTSYPSFRLYSPTSPWRKN